jgi:hypothetical protein
MIISNTICSGVVKLSATVAQDGWKWEEQVEDLAFHCLLRCHLGTGYLVPNLKPARTFPAVCFRLEPMATWTEVVTNWTEGRQKALRMPG